MAATFLAALGDAVVLVFPICACCRAANILAWRENSLNINPTLSKLKNNVGRDHTLEIHLKTE